MSDYHVSATIHLSASVPSPKTRGVRTGYNPHHKFEHFNWVASGAHMYGDEKLHFPGETLFTLISFASWEYMRDKINVGDRFDILEVDRLIGHGTIESIP